MNNILRDEWGFRGFVLTDYYGVYGYQDADRMIRNGNDCMLVAYDTETNHLTDQKSATSVQAMLMYGKEASNRKQEIDRQHYTIPNQRPKDKHCGKI